MPSALTSVHGRRLGLAANGALIANDIEISRPCVDATVTVSNEDTNVRTITIQLKDASGADIDYVEMVEIVVFTSTAMTAFAATGGSTGIAIGTDGALLAVVAKKYFLATSEADGDIDLTWTDTGTEAAVIGVRLPNGRIVLGSQALTNA